VEMFPGIKQEELLEHIDAADVCLGIFGATNKAKRVVPNKVYEAMACRKPLLTGETVAASEVLIDRVHCLFAKVADAQDLAEKILELKNDAQLREKISAQGYKLYLESCSPKVLGKELLNILDNFEIEIKKR
jgi:glycosyltransferase involved in cell wall biosynthesis